MKIPADIAPSIMEKPPIVKIKAVLTADKNTGKTVEVKDQS